MGPVPCIALRDLWDRSHVWLSETHGTGPIAQLGLHIITSYHDIMTPISLHPDTPTMIPSYDTIKPLQ